LGRRFEGLPTHTRAHLRKQRKHDDMSQERELRLGKRAVAVCNREKLLYPAAKFSKTQIIDYFLRIATILLPHFRDRPVTLKRFPDGIHAEGSMANEIAKIKAAVNAMPTRTFADVKYLSPTGLQLGFGSLTFGLVRPRELSSPALAQAAYIG
jgi:hypothetical protein